MFRDLLRGSGLGIRSVKKVVGSLEDALEDARSPLVSKFGTLFDEERRRRQVLAGVEKLWERVEGLDDYFGFNFPKDKSLVANDPPMLLYALIEADEGPAQGRRLGPLASIIFAETFRRAIYRRRGLVGRRTADWEEQVARWARKAFEDRNGSPNSMRELIATLHADNSDAVLVPEAT